MSKCLCVNDQTFNLVSNIRDWSDDEDSDSESNKSKLPSKVSPDQTSSSKKKACPAEEANFVDSTINQSKKEPSLRSLGGPK